MRYSLAAAGYLLLLAGGRATWATKMQRIRGLIIEVLPLQTSIHFIAKQHAILYRRPRSQRRRSRIWSRPPGTPEHPDLVS